MMRMVEPHPFSIRIVPDLLNESRSRWTVCEGTQILVRSPHSYATRREADQEANKAMEKLVSLGRHSQGNWGTFASWYPRSPAQVPHTRQVTHVCGRYQKIQLSVGPSANFLSLTRCPSWLPGTKG